MGGKHMRAATTTAAARYLSREFEFEQNAKYRFTLQPNDTCRFYLNCFFVCR